MSQQELAALCLRLNRLVVESELEVAELEHRLADVTERGRDLLDKFTTRVRQLQRLKQQYDETKHKVTQLAGLEDDVLALRKQVAELERALRTAKTVPSSATASEESSDSSTVESLSIRAELLRAHNVTLEDQLRRVKQQQHEKDQTIAQLHGDLKRVQQSVAEQLIVKDEVIQKLEHTIDELRQQLAHERTARQHDEQRAEERLQSALSEYEHKMQRQREDSASLLSDVAELSETIKLRDMTCSDLTRREKELLGKLDEQTKLNANLENDIRLIYKKHQQDLKEVAERYKYEDYRSRYTAVVQDRDALVEHVTDCWSVVEDSLELTALQQELSSHLVGTTALFLERAQHVSQVRDQVVTNQQQLEHVHAQQTRAMLEMRAAIHERESVVDTLTGECQQLHLQLSHVTQHLAARDDMIHNLRADLAAREDEISDLQSSVTELTAELLAHQALAESSQEITQEQLERVNSLNTELYSELDQTRQEVLLQLSALQGAQHEAQLLKRTVLDRQRDVQHLTREVESLRETIEFIEQERIIAESHANDLNDQIRQVNEQLGSAHDDNARLTAEIAEMQREIVEQRATVEARDQNIAHLDGDLAEIRAAHEHVTEELTRTRDQLKQQQRLESELRVTLSETVTRDNEHQAIYSEHVEQLEREISLAMGRELLLTSQVHSSTRRIENLILDQDDLTTRITDLQRHVTELEISAEELHQTIHARDQQIHELTVQHEQHVTRLSEERSRDLTARDEELQRMRGHYEEGLTRVKSEFQSQLEHQIKNTDSTKAELTAQLISAEQDLTLARSTIDELTHSLNEARAWEDKCKQHVEANTQLTATLTAQQSALTGLESQLHSLQTQCADLTRARDVQIERARGLERTLTEHVSELRSWQRKGSELTARLAEERASYAAQCVENELVRSELSALVEQHRLGQHKVKLLQALIGTLLLQVDYLCRVQIPRGESNNSVAALLKKEASLLAQQRKLTELHELYRGACAEVERLRGVISEHEHRLAEVEDRYEELLKMTKNEVWKAKERHDVAEENCQIYASLVKQIYDQLQQPQGDSAESLTGKLNQLIHSTIEFSEQDECSTDN